MTTSILIQKTVSAFAQSQKDKMRALTTTTGVPLPVHASAIHLHLTARQTFSLIARFAPAFAKIKGNAMIRKRFGMKQFAPVSVAQANAQTTSSGMMLTANVSALQKLAKLEKHGTLRDVCANASLLNARMILKTITSSKEKNAFANVTHLLLLAKQDSSTIPIVAHASAHQSNVHLLPSGPKSTALVYAKLISAQQIPTGELMLKMKTNAAASANLTIAQAINIGMNPFAIVFAPIKNAQMNISGTLSSVNADALLKTAAAVRPMNQLLTLRLVLAFVLKT